MDIDIHLFAYSHVHTSIYMSVYHAFFMYMMCMYIYTYICVHILVYAHTRTGLCSMHTCVYMYVYIHIEICVCIVIFVCICVCIINMHVQFSTLLSPDNPKPHDPRAFISTWTGYAGNTRDSRDRVPARNMVGILDGLMVQCYCHPYRSLSSHKKAILSFTNTALVSYTEALPVHDIIRILGQFPGKLSR